MGRPPGGTIGETLAGQKILLTGFTGFVGKCLVWKLLKSVPSVGTIFVLVRGDPKKKMTATERFNAIVNDIPFTLLEKQSISKLSVIEGDLSCDWTSFRQLTTGCVDIVIHAAATVNFEESIKKAVEVNVTGTKRLLAFCNAHLKPRLFLYVSTGYSHCDVMTHVTESIPRLPALDTQQVVAAIDWMTEEMGESVKGQLLGSKPNSYVFAKALCENMINDSIHECSFPVAIARPTIVGAACSEPAPGFIDNYNALTGAWLAYGHGIWRVTSNDSSLNFDCIPVDICVNGIIATVSHCLRASDSGGDAARPITIVNLSTSSTNPCTWNVPERTQWRCRDEVPFDNAVRYPLCFTVRTKLAEKIISLIYQDLFAKLYDLLLLASGSRFRLSRITDKMYRLFNTTSFFVQHQWTWEDRTLMQVDRALAHEDREAFPILASHINWVHYYFDYYLGIKKYLLKENTEDMRTAKRRQLALKGMHYVGEPVILISILSLMAYAIFYFVSLLL